MMKYLLSFFFFISTYSISAQMPYYRNTDYSNVSNDTTIPFPIRTVAIESYGGKGDSIVDNTLALQNAIADLTSTGGGTVRLSHGAYLFSGMIQITSNNIHIEGLHPNQTRCYFTSNMAQSAISVYGSRDTSSFYIKYPITRRDRFFVMDGSHPIGPGSYLYLYDNDSAVVASTWAYGTLGQLVQVASVSADTVFLYDEIRRSYNLANIPRINIITPVNNFKIDNLFIKALQTCFCQRSLLRLDFVSNFDIHCLQTQYCDFSHIELNMCYKGHVHGNYATLSYDYGGGGRGYGIALQTATSNVLVENNILEHLRHSILLQSGANGNVVSYNYSFDPYWIQAPFPTNASGDLVLHGNWPYANLFEGNEVQNIVIDNSHGKNGFYNTFYRNRAALRGMIVSSSSCVDSCHFIANEVSDSALGIYLIQGTNHIEIANRYREILYTDTLSAPISTSMYLTDSLYSKTNFIGWPLAALEYRNTAYIRYEQNNLIPCEDQYVFIEDTKSTNNTFQLYEFDNNIYIQNHEGLFVMIALYTSEGKEMINAYTKDMNLTISLKNYPAGFYIAKCCSINECKWIRVRIVN